jgi:topoisomerase-4 subunit B
MKNMRRIKRRLFSSPKGILRQGSMTKSRNAETQAVFSLKGKPQNCFGMKKKIVYENEELNLLQHALDIEEGIENLRYNNVIIATDADHDGMHIRFLLSDFFLTILSRTGHQWSC